MTPQQIIASTRNAQGRIDTRMAVALLVSRGHSRLEAAAHLIAAGCPAHLAYQRAAEAIANR